MSLKILINILQNNIIIILCTIMIEKIMSDNN